MSALKKLSIGVQSFSKLIEEDFIYVDKTEYIYKLITKGSYYFLSRPRRFGKSLLISTLKEIFAGNRKLFESTFIAQTNYQWEEHPIIHLSFSLVSSKTAQDLERDILRSLERIGQRYGIDIRDEISIPMKMVSLVERLAFTHKVVILIDEYDYPLLNNIDNLELANACRDVLRNFFATLKDLDDYIEFIFITGITPFSLTSIFSGLNNVKDLTLDPNAAKLLGYTSEEIVASFQPHLIKHSKKSGHSVEKLLEDIQHWYNGYLFSEENEGESSTSLKMYNPFSVLLYLADGKFLNYWFESGTPSFLVHLIKTQNYAIFDIEGSEVNVAETRSYDLEKIQFIPLLWQTGYLTIKNYNPDSKNYTLAFPNEEVRTSFPALCHALSKEHTHIRGKQTTQIQ